MVKDDYQQIDICQTQKAAQDISSMYDKKLMLHLAISSKNEPNEPLLEPMIFVQLCPFGEDLRNELAGNLAQV